MERMYNGFEFFNCFFPGGGELGGGGLSLRVIVIGPFDKDSSFLIVFWALTGWVRIRIYGEEMHTD